MKYIAFYDTEEYKDENRCVTPSTRKLVRYMAEVMSNSNPVEIVSPTRTLNKNGWYRGRVSQIGEKVFLRHPPTFGAKTIVGRFFAIIFVRIWLFLYLLFHVKHGETIVVYHGLSYMFTVRLMQKLKRLHLIMEVREIYADVNQGTSEKKRERELQYLQQADAYIVATELLNKKINTQNKRYIVASGVYEKTDIMEEKWNDGKIHIVYAGTLDPNKGGAQNLMETAKFLSSQYHVHILGFGSKADIQTIEEKIAAMRQESDVMVTYDGVLFGTEFEHFLQKCHIGVALQDRNGKFNDTSFPSKILTYLSNGLEVVSSDIPAVKESPVGGVVHYYTDPMPEKIAKAISGIDLENTVNAGELMDSLDRTLKNDIVELFKEQ